ncbi:hypothetical protein MMC20_001764 [Loxospora ochrophaea]|nr:hypothetical protein [Loxospora ochrophaea]
MASASRRVSNEHQRTIDSPTHGNKTPHSLEDDEWAFVDHDGDVLDKETNVPSPTSNLTRTSWLGTVHELQGRLKALEEEMATRKAVERDIQEHFKSLDLGTRQSRIASERYRKSRYRFLDNYRQDLDTMFQGRRISVGNDSARYGDVVTDADSSITNDQAGNDDSIALVNARATARAHHKITLADKVDKLFSRFWLLLSEDFNQSPTKNPTSFLGVAYYQFWDAYAKLQ